MSNYRPISLLSITSKFLERLFHNCLVAHMLEHDLLSTKQYGFRKGSSTQEALLATTQDWYVVLEEGGSVVCIFFDQSKAFNPPPPPNI